MTTAAPGREGRRIRVLFASHGGTLRGGAERSLLALLSALSAVDGVEPVVTVPADGPLAWELRARGFRVIVVSTPKWTPVLGPDLTPSQRAAKRARSLAATSIRSWRWIGLLRAERPDVVVSNTVTIASPAFAAKTLRIPHVWMIRELVTGTHGLSYPVGERVSQRTISALSDRVVVNSETAAQHLSRVPRTKIVVAHPPVEVPGVPPLAPDHHSLRLLMLGHQSRAKGSQLAVRALALVPEGVPRPQLRLVGTISPEFHQELVELTARLGVGGLVTVAGPTSQPFVAIEDADVLLMCSQDEAFGRVTAEALKAGRPVIGGASGGTVEIISHGEDGLLFEPGDAEGLEAAITLLASDRALLLRMGARAAERNADRFTVEEHVSIMTDVLRSVTARR